ncbi:hypothetical protein C7447_1036 [Tenacibaculum adriaticum]|uniref:Uncharacterized protein n=1 Tax=Tenacibaculum adriaticum TaxID=413713 RepID=A0A5S5DPM7_9FLAO|nr:hypothetical protein [Tenacibaculum adriaticum]TYP97841.1 hypothetical protein C7447_1036 [Tenacibaculum adriaticum]
MSLLHKFQQKEFWINVLKVGLPFFIIVTIIILFMNNGKAIISGDFETVYQANFANQKWIRFWLIKIVISLGYGMYITNKNMK